MLKNVTTTGEQQDILLIVYALIKIIHTIIYDYFQPAYQPIFLTPLFFFFGYKQSRAWIEDSILLLSLTI